MRRLTVLLPTPTHPDLAFISLYFDCTSLSFPRTVAPFSRRPLCWPRADARMDAEWSPSRRWCKSGVGVGAGWEMVLMSPLVCFSFCSHLHAFCLVWVAESGHLFALRWQLSLLMMPRDFTWVALEKKIVNVIEISVALSVPTCFGSYRLSRDTRPTGFWYELFSAFWGGLAYSFLC